MLVNDRDALPGEADPQRSAEDMAGLTYRNTAIVQLSAKHLADHRIVAFNKSDPSNWMFDMLRTKVLQKMDEKGWKTIAVTSPTPACGKTVVSINLAMSIAHQPNRTSVLVDFDLRRPKVATYLGLNRSVSLNEVLLGSKDIADAMINPGLQRMTVLHTNRPLPKPAELLSSRKVSGIIKELRDKYPERVVIFDLPPVLYVDDAMTVLPQIDCVLVVVGNGQCTQREVEECLRHVPEANLMGVVMNMGDIPIRTYQYSQY